MKVFSFFIKLKSKTTFYPTPSLSFFNLIIIPNKKADRLLAVCLEKYR